MAIGFDDNDPFESMRRMMEAARHYENMRRQLSNPVTDLAGQLSTQMRELDERQQSLQRILGPADHVKLLQGIVEGMDHVERMRPILDRMRVEGENWRRMVEAIEQHRRLSAPQQSALLASWSTWQSTSEQLARTLASYEALVPSARSLARITAPLDLFSSYARETLKITESAANKIESRAAVTSLVLANEQITSATAVATELLSADGFDAGEIGGPPSVSVLDLPPGSVLFRVQQQQILSAGARIIALSGEELLLLPAAAKTGQRAREVGRLVCECNRAAKFSNREEVFKPTTTLVESVMNLPFVIATDRESLGTFIDWLFFTLYEGAGDEKLRFLSENGGVIDKADPALAAIWAIKALRNKTLRHDPDHGADKKIEKSWSGLNSSLRDIGIDAWPATPEDHTRIQDAVLDATIAFLRTLLVRLAVPESNHEAKT